MYIFVQDEFPTLGVIANMLYLTWVLIFFQNDLTPQMEPAVSLITQNGVLEDRTLAN